MKKLLTLFLMLLFLCGCASEKPEIDNSKLQVYASFHAVYDFADKIGKDKIQLFCMTPSGTEPHNWEPTSGDMLSLENADILFYNGNGMESWTDKIKTSIENPNIKYIELSKAVTTYNSKDPHIWLNPLNVLKEAEVIKTALAEADPANKEFYEKNYEIFSADIKKLDSAYRESLSKYKNKTIIVAHEAYGFLCEEYGIEQTAIEGLSADSEPSPAKMAEISSLVKEKNIKYIFFEELLTPKAAEVIAEETGAELLVLNPFEGLTEEEIKNGDDYFSIMYKNLENIQKALGE